MHPYRTPHLRCAASPRVPDPLGVAQAVTEVFLLGWSFVRVAICSVRGLDLEGLAALVIVVAALSSLTHPGSRFS